jgi:hypothetical protein
MIGINNFYLIIKIDDYFDYSKNHYQIIEPLKDLTVRVLCNIVDVDSDKYVQLLISDNFKLIKIDDSHKLNNDTTLILIKNELYNTNFNTVEYVKKYVKEHVGLSGFTNSIFYVSEPEITEVTYYPT